MKDDHYFNIAGDFENVNVIVAILLFCFLRDCTFDVWTSELPDAEYFISAQYQ